MALISTTYLVPGILLGNGPMKAVQRLHRQLAFESSLPPEENPEARLEVRSLVEKIWRPVSEFENYEQSLVRIRENLDEVKPRLDVLAPKMTERLSAEINAITAPELLKKCSKRFKESVYSSSISPIRKSENGVNGPTILVSFSRCKKEAGFTEAYVAKLTNKTERQSQYLYSAISNGLSKEIDRHYCFVVPQTATFDLEGKILETTEKELHKLDTPTCRGLRCFFTKIVELSKRPIPEEHNQMMFMERVQGEDLLDFASSKYPMLTPEQKEKLFHHLGRLSFLDLILGNRDRLVQIYETSENEILFNEDFPDNEDNASKRAFTFQSSACNLANVMIVWDEEHSEQLPIVYAIDNCIDSYLIKDRDWRDGYLDFLKLELSSPKFGQKMAENIVQSIKKALDVKIIFNQRAVREHLTEQLAPFLEDLNPIGLSAFAKGADEMCRYINKILIPQWESDSIYPLKSYMAANCLDFFDSIQERLNICKLRDGYTETT